MGFGTLRLAAAGKPLYVRRWRRLLSSSPMKPLRSALFSLVVAVCAASVRADWQRDTASLAWTCDGAVVWKFSFDPKEGKPHFATLATGAGADLAVVHPSDHYWHYGLWFSWKFINGVNYWEEDGPGQRSEGTTRWKLTDLNARADGSAQLHFVVTYSRPEGRIELIEQRVLRISAPAADGSYRIDWTAHFTATGSGAVLDRTPMPGEPGGKVNGGYGGLGLRLPSQPATMAVLTPTGAVTQFESDRARPFAAAIACNFGAEGRDLGGVAVVNLSGSVAAALPWYVVNGEKMRFVCAAVLAPQPLTLAAGEPFDLHYRIVVRPAAWTAEALAAAAAPAVAK